ncbi:MAG: ribonucleoside-diphosphate reductase subunit alpha [Candidatus Sericytochromatia bacterium]|nr:ribonucleoside-diphosphate reductase subunit alpha [Candidatus Sericytochromatia bacterium]
MQVIKRDGTREAVKFEKILNAVSRACDGLQGVESVEVAKQTISGLNEGTTTRELDERSIATAVMLMTEEPNYSKVASRLLSTFIHEEVGLDAAFVEYLHQGVDLGLIDPAVVTLAETGLTDLIGAIDHKRDQLFEYFGLKTVYDRYLLRHPISRRVIERPQWMFMRVALGLSETVAEAISLYEIVSTFQYMPASPTLFNSGTQHAQMSSCYLLTVGDDSLEGIYKAYTDCARLSKWSGGIGIDWTPVRAAGALIKGNNGISSGLIPFLKVMDSSVHAVNQGGKRKGAAAIYVQPWHADIESFLDLRNNTGAEERRTHHLNLALWIPDLFMRRVEADAEWSLFCPSDYPELIELWGDAFDTRYEALEAEGKARRSVSARALYARMLQTLAETGNGWFCFKDASNRRSAQTKLPGNVIHSSNLCTEILEVTSASETAVCNLGSVNVGAFVTADSTFDFEGLRKVVRTAVKFLDRVIDRNFYPTAEAANSNKRWRPVGLGLMGLQDALFKLRLPFESDAARTLSSRISEVIYYEALQASLGTPFPAYEESRYTDGTLQIDLAKSAGASLPALNEDWAGLRQRIVEQGLRNSQLIAIAPTATIGAIVGAYECVEPQISNLFKRETLSGEFLQINRYLVEDLKQLGLWHARTRSQLIAGEGSIQAIEGVPDELKALYKTAWELPQKNLIDMAADRSAFICQSQSLNLFQENPNMGKLSSMYMYAWKTGLKTTYYLRSRARTAIAKTTLTDLDAQDLQETSAIACSLENPESCESCQ